MTVQISTEISRLVATALDKDAFGSLRADIEKSFPAPPRRKQVEEALASSSVYQIAASRPGYAPDGAPGYLSQDMDLRAEVLRELRNMAGADFDEGEHAARWAEIEDRMAGVPESQYREGLSVVCPDDYVLSLLCMSCAEALAQRGVNIWAES